MNRKYAGGNLTEVPRKTRAGRKGLNGESSEEWERSGCQPKRKWLGSQWNAKRITKARNRQYLTQLKKKKGTDHSGWGTLGGVVGGTEPMGANSRTEKNGVTWRNSYHGIEPSVHWYKRCGEISGDILVHSTGESSNWKKRNGRRKVTLIWQITWGGKIVRLPWNEGQSFWFGKQGKTKRETRKTNANLWVLSGKKGKGKRGKSLQNQGKYKKVEGDKGFGMVEGYTLKELPPSWERKGYRNWVGGRNWVLYGGMWVGGRHHQTPPPQTNPGTIQTKKSEG